MQHAIALRQEAKQKPAFTVTKLEGKRTETRHLFDDKKKKIVQKTVELDAGYMVVCAKGHSVRLDQAGLDRLMDGDPTVKLVDMESGEVVGHALVELD